MIFLSLNFYAAFWLSPVARAEDEALYMVGLEIHASRSLTSVETEENFRYLFHNIMKWVPVLQ
jgi:hypothetical protein